MSKTAKLMFLPRAKSEVKKELHNHNLDIVKTGHDGEMAVIEFAVPEGFELQEFYNDIRHKNRDIR